MLYAVTETGAYVPCYVTPAQLSGGLAMSHSQASHGSLGIYAQRAGDRLTLRTCEYLSLAIGSSGAVSAVRYGHRVVRLIASPLS